jgi:hypothetical protein
MKTKKDDEKIVELGWWQNRTGNLICIKPYDMIDIRYDMKHERRWLFVNGVRIKERYDDKDKYEIKMLGWWKNDTLGPVYISPNDRIDLRYCTKCKCRWIILNLSKRIKNMDCGCDVCSVG